MSYYNVLYSYNKNNNWFYVNYVLFFSKCQISQRILSLKIDSAFDSAFVKYAYTDIVAQKYV